MSVIWMRGNSYHTACLLCFLCTEADKMTKTKCIILLFTRPVEEYVGMFEKRIQLIFGQLQIFLSFFPF